MSGAFIVRRGGPARALEHRGARVADRQEARIQPERYDLARSMFLSALARPSREREAFLDAETDGQAGLRAEVVRLLERHRQALDGEPWPTAPDDLDTLRGPFGPYRIERRLGRGPVGVVFLARAAGGAPVALKVLRPGLLSALRLSRLPDEAAPLQRLGPPGIARLLDAGVLETPAGPRAFLVSEFAPGPDVREWAAAGETSPLEQLARACDAVHGVHEAGVVHRDLKPGNLRLGADGAPDVLDFALARLLECDRRAASAADAGHVVVETLRYTSPEQSEVRFASVDPRADVYALGAVAYEVVTGQPPFDVPRDSIHEALRAVHAAPPRPLAGAASGVHAALAHVLGRALAKDPDDRQASAAELAEDLRSVASGRATRAARRRRSAPRPAWLRRALLALALLAALAAGIWLAPRLPPDWGGAARRSPADSGPTPEAR